MSGKTAVFVANFKSVMDILKEFDFRIPDLPVCFYSLNIKSIKVNSLSVKASVLTSRKVIGNKFFPSCVYFIYKGINFFLKLSLKQG
jgi:hypothetical protein